MKVFKSVARNAYIMGR